MNNSNSNNWEHYLNTVYPKDERKADIVKTIGLVAFLGVCIGLWYIFVRCLFSF